MTLNQAIGEVFREKLTLLGMKTAEFAEKAGVSQGYVSKLVNGKFKSIGIDTMMRLVAPFGISIDQFLHEVEKKKSSEGVSLSRADVEDLMRMMTCEEKRGFLRRLKARLPEIPEWLKTENHIKYVQNLPDEPLIQGIAADGRQEYGSGEQPQHG